MALAAAVACGKKEAADSSAEAATPPLAPADAAPPDAAGSRQGLTLHTSIRCSECHNKMRDEWRPSAHAGSSRSPVYRRARSLAGKRGPACDRCHQPLAHYAGADDPVAVEGVTCDVCHNIREVDMDAAGVRFQLTAYDMVKYGPLCDAEPHYFHRMGCSELHERAELCGSCHQLVRQQGAVEVPIYTTYADWKAGPYAEDGVVCQHCHMPGSRAVVAEGSPPRNRVRHHGFMGGESSLRQRAAGLAVEVTAGEQADQLAVAVTVENRKAGHYIPSGLPGRRLVVRVRALTAAGAEQSPPATRMLGRVLVDAAGAEVPYLRAVEVASDSRIAPRDQRTESFVVTAPEAGTLEVVLEWLSMSEPVARGLGVDPALVRREVMTRLSVALAGPGPKGRRGLPARKAVRP